MSCLLMDIFLRIILNLNFLNSITQGVLVTDICLPQITNTNARHIANTNKFFVILAYKLQLITNSILL